MNILVLVGSPRKNGNTEILADSFIEGAKLSGNTVKKVCLRGLKISGCLGCGYCKKHEGECVIKDDMQQIYPLIDDAQMIVFATPVYFYSMSSQLKAVLDRFYAKHNFEMKIDKCALLSVAADDESVFESLIKMYEDNAGYLNWQDMGKVTVHGVSAKGDIIGNEGLELAKKLGQSIK